MAVPAIATTDQILKLTPGRSPNIGTANAPTTIGAIVFRQYDPDGHGHDELDDGEAP